MRHACSLRALLGVLLLAQVGCLPTPAPGPPGVRSRAARPQQPPLPEATALPPGQAAATPSPAQGSPPPVGPASPQPLGTEAPARVAATLSGLVRAPVRLIGDMGGAIVSNNGGGIVSNNGGGLLGERVAGYRLGQAPPEAEALVANVEVAVLDATGAIVRAPDGRELRTRTDATGRYTFTAPLPAHHVVVQAGRSAQQAALQRIIAAGVREGDMTVPTTLVAAYVLEKFVKPQPDPQATLDRLPAPVEAETVAIAATAAANLSAVTLTQAAAAASVEALRKQDSRLDGQMEVVKKLLIVAGLSDLGEGLPGLRVPMPDAQHVLEAPDGTLVINARGDRRIWRLEKDGTVRTLAGRKEGVAAADDIGPIDRLTWLPDGRLLAQETWLSGRERLWRLSLEGVLERLTPDVPELEAAVALDAKRFWLLGRRTGAGARTWFWEPGKAAVAGPVLTDVIGSLQVAVALPDGRIRCGGMDGRPVPGVWEVEPTTGQVQRLESLPNGGRWPRLDTAGRTFYTDSAGQMRERVGPGSATDPVRPEVPALGTFTVDSQGSILLARDGQVMRRSDSSEEVLAGTRPAATYPLGSAIPMGYGFEPGGEMLLAADGVLSRQRLGEEPSSITAIQAIPDPKGGAPFNVDRVVVLPDGTVLLRGNRVPMSTRGDLDCDALFTVSVGGNLAPYYRAPANIAEMVVAPNGALWLVEQRFEGLSPREHVVVLSPDGATQEVLSEAVIKAGIDFLGYSKAGKRLGFTADGTLHVVKTTYSADFKSETRVIVPVVAGIFQAPLPPEAVFPEAVDVLGRWYEGEYKGVIRRWDPRTGQTEVVAGPGGRAFTGTGVNDGLKGARSLQFSPVGDLYFLDGENRQIKRIPAADL
ncbi:MAG: hypothetical protein VKQ33_14710 [Candidatus Sericytochromatia bacterium]|nr:hypothetical protein [Candidatus Sericytochromatia bacterium]